MLERFCVIVDGFSTGKQLAPEFQKRGFNCIHIKSSHSLPSRFSHRESDFVKSYVFDGSLEPLIAELKTYPIAFCIPGSESGVELADQLSEKLGLISNGTARSHARRNKYEMTEVVRNAGIKTVKHFKSSDAKEIIAWAQREVSQFPVVLKPLESASNDSIYFCHNADEIIEAHQKISQSLNLFGQKNNEVLAQSFNYGQEFIINTVSWDGQHWPAEIWRIQKQAGTVIYDRAEIVHEDEKEYIILFDYVAKVLNALQIRYGAATTEVKYTPDGSSVLIESAARLMGGSPISLLNDVLGTSQFAYLVEAYTNSKQFLEMMSLRIAPSQKKYAWAVVLVSDATGIVKNELDLAEIKKLPSYHSHAIDITPGKVLKATVDYLTAPGEIYLISNSSEQLYKDYKKIRQLERNGLYRTIIETNENQNSNPVSTGYRFWESLQQSFTRLNTSQPVLDQSEGANNVQITMKSTTTS